MLFCNKSTIEKIREWDERSVHDLDVTQLYTYVCPALLVFCLLSVLFNSVLMAIGHFRQGINRSPILVLSLNLATTDTIASLLTGLGLFLNSYLPVVFNVHISLCQLLVIEIFRVASLVASVLHLLALALVHYRGIVRPLHYR
ncbi:hypothetical protein GZH46_01364 [Fragariocoptes setiger]|uniref:G-protein coupled receptors family 1 profile domain-containing protein n=1 Tax=Fragariocoptes setiger TaxID=1670756 RepID=A0ABQ7S9N4_9ACAR|nr:hypothetical protein GZH46_01364 [Fragariocoptes setiger]